MATDVRAGNSKPRGRPKCALRLKLEEVPVFESFVIRECEHPDFERHMYRAQRELAPKSFVYRPLNVEAGIYSIWRKT